MSSSSSSNPVCEACGQEFNSSTAYEIHLTEDRKCSTMKRKEELKAAGLSEQQAWSWTFFEEGYSAKGISQIRNKKKNTIESHLQRARNKKKDAEKLLETLEKPRKNTPHVRDHEKR